jgi:hypothetical protein
MILGVLGSKTLTQTFLQTLIHPQLVKRLRLELLLPGFLLPGSVCPHRPILSDFFKANILKYQ